MPTEADILFRDFVIDGDPTSGVHNPAKKDFRDLGNLMLEARDEALDAADAAAGSAASATGTPQYATTAQLASATVPAFADSVIVGGRVYVRDDVDGRFTSQGGRRWTLLDFRGRFERMQADMLQGVSTVIIAYGDSTTDGNGTTDWTANPTNGSNQAIGAAAHNPINAWPAVCQGAIRSMTGNVSVGIRNAGYSGKQLQDGWAYANYDAAIAPYGTPTAVMVQFGINDVRQAGFTPAGFETELLKLCRRIAKSGAFPIFVTPDEPSAEQHNGWLLAKVAAVYRSVAAQIGVRVIDWGTAQMQLVQCSDNTDLRWGADQPDDTHGNDTWHSIKGGFIAASLYPNTLFVTEPITDVAPWSRYCKPKPGYTVYQDTLNKFGGAMVVGAGTYATDEFLIDLWVWSVGAARKMYWATVDGNGYWSPRTLANAPLIGMRDWISRVTQTVIAPGSGALIGPNGARDGESMGLVFRVPQGLSRWSFRAPRDTTANDVYLGYFSIREVEPVFAIAVPMFGSAASPTIFDRDPQGDIPQVYGFQPGGRVTSLALTVDLQQGTGVSLWASRVYGGSVTRENNRKRGLFLYRHPDDRLFLYSLVFNADGSIGSSTSLGSTASPLTWAGLRRLRLTAGVSGDTTQYINVFDGWSSSSAIISATNALTNEPWPWGGTPGAVWQHTGYTGVASVTIYGEI